MADETVTISLTLDKKDADRVLKALDGDFKKAGDDAGKGFTSGIKGALTSIGRQVFSLKSAFAGLATAIGGAFAFKEIISAANEQEDAINRLNTALKQNGQFTIETSNALQLYAAQLQQTTRFGDEAILNNLALAQSFGATAEQSKEIVAAATDLSAAFGIELESATRNISKTLGGLSGELGEVIPELKNLSAEQLRNGEGVRLLAERYRGFAAQDVKTFSGAIDQLGNAFGDLQEELGFIITRSPIIREVISRIAKSIQDLTKEVTSFGNNGGLKQILLSLVEFAQGVNDFVITPIELAFNGVKVFFNGINTAISGIVAGIGQSLGVLGSALSKLGIAPETSESFQNFSETSLAVFNENIDATSRSLDSAFGTEKSDSINNFLVGLRESINSFNESGGANLGGITEDQKEKTQQDTTEVLGFWESLYRGITENQKEFEKDTKASFKNLSGEAVVFGQAAKKGIGQGIGAGFASFGAALVSGENALDAFAKSFLSTLGGLMIQQGTAFILQGLGFQVIPGLQGSGAALVGTGAALAAFGGALTAIGGGGASKAGASAGGVGGGAIGADSTISTDLNRQELEENLQEPQTAVNVTIQGDVLDSEESGGRIVNILNDAFDKQGVVVSNNARFA